MNELSHGKWVPILTEISKLSLAWGESQFLPSIFSHKIKELLSFVFKHSNALKAYSQKHLGITLDFKLSVKEHLNNVLKKLTKQ